MAKYLEAILLHSVSQLEKLWDYRNSACKVSVLFKKMKFQFVHERFRLNPSSDLQTAGCLVSCEVPYVRGEGPLAFKVYDLERSNTTEASQVTCDCD